MNKEEFKSGRTEARNALLRDITKYFLKQSDVIAIYNFGSLGRGEEDEFSDLDIYIVTTDQSIQNVIKNRIEIYKNFGKILLLYETSQNNPLGGNYSSVLYKNEYGPQHIDIYFCPEVNAHKSLTAKTLFERKELPIGDWIYDREAKPKRNLEERVDFVIFMTFICIKKIIRKQKDKEIVEFTLEEYKTIKKFTYEFKDLYKESKGFNTIIDLLNILKIYSNNNQLIAIKEIKQYFALVKSLYI